MCIAIAGRLIAAEGRRGRVEIQGNILDVELGAVNAKVGDNVLVHAGCAIAVVKEEEKEELDQLFELIEEMKDEEA